MKSFFARIAAVALCLIFGTGAIQALVINPSMPASAVADMKRFMQLKRMQPVVDMDKRWSLVAGGDIMLSRSVAAAIDRNSPDYPYQFINGVVSSADLAFANFENPVAPGRSATTSTFSFRADKAALPALREAGFDVLSIANNHMSDAGDIRIGETADALSENGFVAVGAGRTENDARTPGIITVKGLRVAFLAYADPRFLKQVRFATGMKAGVAKAVADTMKKDVERVRPLADIVIISLHGGIEYLEKPDAIQRDLLHAAADAGADLVLGHHPHVVQPLENRDGTWIIDSLGNVIFDQLWSDATRRGMLLRFAFDDKTVTDVEAIPLWMEKAGLPEIAEGTHRDDALKGLQRDLADGTVIDWKGNDAAVVTTPRYMPVRSQEPAGFTIHRTMRDNLIPDRTAEIYELSGGVLRVSQDKKVLWQSPSEWWVQDFALADVDGNRTREVVMSVWKSGNYGTSKPFWVKENDASIRNHMFVYGFKGSELQPLWQSSNIPRPNCEITMGDLNGDGVDELVALEGNYTTDAACQATNVSVWRWNSWGFENEWRSNNGRFWNVHLEKNGNGAQIVVNGK